MDLQLPPFCSQDTKIIGQSDDGTCDLEDKIVGLATEWTEWSDWLTIPSFPCVSFIEREKPCVTEFLLNGEPCVPLSENQTDVYIEIAGHSFNDAISRCTDMSGELVKPVSKADILCYLDYTLLRKFWTGYNDINIEAKWGVPDNNMWAPDEPHFNGNLTVEEDCAIASRLGLHGKLCWKEFSFVCKLFVSGV